jgi:SAM-dependent methyltransferase
VALLDDIRRYWDADAPTYDLSSRHRPRDPVVLAAWTAALDRLLPPAPARVLDCGAGTGFLTLIAARLGHRVTALDLSTAMLDRLRTAADAEQLDVEIVVGSADEPPTGFDAIMQRHVLWTLPEPASALAAWRGAADRLVLLESLWGAADPAARGRGRARHWLEGWRDTQPEHHAEYSPTIRRSLPLGTGTPPAQLIDLAAAAGWSGLRIERLRDIEWAERQGLPMPERLLGVTRRVAIVAG